MNTQEAAQVIEAMVRSLQENPAQFHFTVQVTSIGAQGTAYGGGVGMVGIGRDGGTGISASASGGNVKARVVREKANEAAGQQIQELLNHLSAVALELRSPSPDKSKLQKMAEAMKGKLIPDLIVSVVANLISASVGS